MFEVKLNKKGQITFPASVQEKYGLSEGVTLTVTEDGGTLIVKPLYFCNGCKKARVDGTTCPNCTPKIIKVY